MMEVTYKKLHCDAVIPFYGSPGAAAMDITAISCHSVRYGLMEYGTGLSIEIPKGFAGLLFPRSSISNTNVSLSNCVGVIDSDYRGEIKLRFDVSDISLPIIYNKGDRIGQLMLVAIPQFSLVEGELDATERGEGGFGSTGK